MIECYSHILSETFLFYLFFVNNIIHSFILSFICLFIHSLKYILTLAFNVHQVILHQEGHMDDALTVSRSQTEESQAARMIYSTMGLFRQFNKYGETRIHLLVCIA